MILLVVLLAAITLFFFFRYRKNNDEDEVRTFIEKKGGTIVSLRKNVGAAAFDGTSGVRYYDCTYRDKEQTLHSRQLMVSFWQGVAFVE